MQIASPREAAPQEPQDEGGGRVSGAPARPTEIDGATLAAMLHSSLDAIIGKSLDGTVIEWNPGAERLFRYSAKEIIGESIRVVFPVDGADDLANILARIGKGESIVQYETVRVRKDGAQVDVSVSTSPITLADGSIVGAVSVTRDITAQKQAEAEIRALNARLEQRVAERTAQLATANQELEAFTYSVSHDLRAPLRSIDGFSLALLEDYDTQLDDTGRDYLRRVRAATERMASLIDDLLKLARLTRGDLHVEPVDLSILTHQIAGEIQEREMDRHVSFAITEGLKAEGDPVLLRAVLENLLGNSWKFTRTKSEPTISFGARQVDGATDYFVHDDGVGFDMAFADKLFGAFQRLHTTDEFEGTGIGLATVRRIVHRHGGRVWAEGTVGEGATFWFTLQATKGDANHE